MPDIFINTDRPVDRSIVAGINQPQRESPIGAFVAGSSYDINLYFVKNDGSYNALSGVGGTDIHVAISTISRPESGTFTLTDGTDTTSAISYGASAQVVEDALNALNSDTGLNLGTASLVDVVKANDTQYTITFRAFGAMTALSGGAVSLFPESTATGSIAVTGTATIYAQQVIELTRQPAIYQPTWSAITSGFNATVAVDTTRLLQSLVLEKGQPFYIEVKLAGEVVAREVVGMEHSTMPASAFTATAIATLLDAFAADPTTNTNFTASAWITALSTEGTDILSTGEAGAVKYLREDGDGTSSWQTPPGTDDQTGAEIKVAYEAEPDTNAFDDKSKIAAFTAQGTGLLDFDGFAINADTTKFDLGAGSGWVVDNTTNPLVPVVTEVSWVAATAITVTNLATANITYVAINSSGTVVQFTTPLDDNERRDNIFLGNIGHPDNATVTTAFSFPAVAAAPAAQVQDLIEAIGPFNRKGNLYSADSADLNLHRSAGEVFALGANYDNDPKKPHSRSTSAANPIASMLYVFQDGTNSAATAVDPDNYDLATVLTAVPVNKFTVQRVFMFRGGFTNILYGQHVYGSMAAAREGAATDTTVVPQVVLDSAIAMCVIIIKEGATDLQDAGDVFIQNFSPFGGTAGGAQANGTLQGTYDNSSTPEIVTDSIRGALSVQRGSAADTDNIFEGQNGAGTTTFEVTGEGDVNATGSVTSTNTGANAPVSTAQQTAINLPSLTLEESAGLIPFRLPANASPYTDPDADAVITATTTTDERAIAHYQRLIQVMKGMGIWNSLENAYLMGSNWQSSSTTLQSITGGNTATGTGTQSGYYTTFNGTTNKYLFSNVNAGTALTGKTLVAFYKGAGTQAVNALVSSYQGGSSRGPALSVGGAAVGGSVGLSTIDNIYSLACISDGTTYTTITVDEASDEKWSFAGFSFHDAQMNLFGNSRNPTRSALAELWSNNSNFAIGANSNSSHFLDGDMIFAGVFDSGLSDYQMFALKLALESIFSDVVNLPGSIVFDGNSLTASASGGGTNWPTQLLVKAGWGDIERNTNIAKDGGRQTQEIEQEYFTQARQWLGIAGQDNLYFLWSGINDITASLATQDIIDSLKRHSKRAKAEGFRLVLLTLTPVASDGDGTTYTYDAAQQASLAAVNVWIRGEGATIADQVIDLDEIGVATPLFLDPTNSTYYTAGDGLHHNNAGRALIATKIDADVSYPTL
jgi:hypothetical protein